MCHTVFARGFATTSVATHLTLNHGFPIIRLSQPGGCIDPTGSLAERQRRSPRGCSTATGNRTLDPTNGARRSQDCATEPQMVVHDDDAPCRAACCSPSRYIDRIHHHGNSMTQCRVSTTRSARASGDVEAREVREVVTFRSLLYLKKVSDVGVTWHSYKSGTLHSRCRTSGENWMTCSSQDRKTSFKTSRT